MQQGVWTARLAVLAFAVAATVYTLLLAAAPTLGETESWIRMLVSPTCHQMPERSLFIGPSPMAVCSRCIGLFAGGSLGLWFYGLFLRPGLRLSPRWFVAVVVANVLDVGLGMLGLPNLSNLPRSGLGIASGFVVALYLGTGVADIALHRVRRRGQAPVTLPSEPPSV